MKILNIIFIAVCILAIGVNATLLIKSNFAPPVIIGAVFSFQVIAINAILLRNYK